MISFFSSFCVSFFSALKDDELYRRKPNVDVVVDVLVKHDARDNDDVNCDASDSDNGDMWQYLSCRLSSNKKANSSSHFFQVQTSLGMLGFKT